MGLNTGFNKVIALVVVLVFLRKTTAFSGEYDKKCYDSCFRSCVDQGNIPWQCSSHCMDACTSKFEVIRGCHAGCLLQNCNKIMDGNTSPLLLPLPNYKTTCRLVQVPG
uniref:Knottin scorpion toxin-like domain-containing protein n=1 Tax=Salix viminalis TaxID=40686 RepID=A0A6N2MYT7_SALVM